MSAFTEAEDIGRTKFKSWLEAIGANDWCFTEDLYCAVDSEFTYKDVRFAAEIKVRAEKYKDYDTHMLERMKLNGMQTYKEINDIDALLYCCFFGDYLYVYQLGDKYESESCRLARTTAIYSGHRDKEIIWLQSSTATIFKLENNLWTKQS